MHIRKIDVEAVHKLQEESGDVVLLDVREDAEFKSEAAPYAKHFPLSCLNVEEVLQNLGFENETTTPLYFICRSGSRSDAAAKKFYQRGYVNVYNVEGGMLKWQELGLPIRKDDDGS